jgi:hypothetical protein
VTRAEGDSLRNRTFYQTRMRYAVTNARSVPVEVIVTQDGLDNHWNDTRIVSETLPSQRDSSRAATWRVPVPANGTTNLEVVFQTGH